MFSLKRLFSNRSIKPVWMIPIVLFLVLTISVSVLLGYRRYQANLAAEESGGVSTSASSGERVNTTVDPALAAASEQAAIQASIQASKEAAQQAELAAMRAVLDREVIYEGITINGLPVGGQTRAMVTQMLVQYVEKARAGFSVEVMVDDKTLVIKPDDAGLTFNAEAIIDEAYAIGRQTKATTEPERTLERFASVEALKQTPVKLALTSTIDPEKVKQSIADWVASMKNAPVEAKVTGFDLATKSFKITESAAGVVIDVQAAATKIIDLLNAGHYQIRETLDAKVTQPQVTTQALKDRLGFVSTAKTLAGSSSSSNRDHNISLAARSVNGHIVQPGETFSFNRVVGKRTVDRGFRDAPAILGGVLVPTIGGGICQAATTLYQAAMKADLEIVDRRPHSWPSGYTSIGLDATINWPSTDFKFRNNTNFPIAIVASFSKPNLVFSIYGRQLDAGVSINLKSVHNGYVDEPAPIYQVNPNLKPGTKVEIRQGRRGQRASAYKIWIKNGTEIRRELAATSYYRPIQAIYEVGPEANTTPTPTVGPTPTTSPTPTPDPEPTPDPTPVVTPTPTPTPEPEPTTPATPTPTPPETTPPAATVTPAP